MSPARAPAAVAEAVVVAPPVAVEPREDTRAALRATVEELVRVAVEDAVAPLRLRISEFERRSLETTTPVPTLPAPRFDVPAPATLPPSIAAFTVESIPTLAPPPSDIARTEASFGVEAWLDGNRRKRKTAIVLAAGMSLGLLSLFGLIAACS